MLYELSEIVPYALDLVEKGESFHGAARTALKKHYRKTTLKNISTLKDLMRDREDFLNYESDRAEKWYSNRKNCLPTKE